MRFLWLIFALFSVYLYNKLTRNGSCSPLLTEGYFKTGHFYQPTGCMLHNYSTSEVHACFQSERDLERTGPVAVFIGDSRLRQQFKKMKALAEGTPYVYKQDFTDLFYKDILEFRWHPLESGVDFVDRWHSIYRHGAPRFAVLGISLHFIAWAKDEEDRRRFLARYKDTVRSLVARISHINDTQFIWMMQDPTRHENETNQLYEHNEFARSVLKDSNIQIWRSNQNIALQFMAESDRKGRHLGDEALYWDAQILLNLFCNQLARPSDATCCQGDADSTVSQRGHMTLIIASFTIALLLLRRKTRMASQTHGVKTGCDEESGFSDHQVKIENHTGESTAHNDTNFLKQASTPNSCFKTVALKVIWIMIQFATMVSYIHMCARTDVFHAENLVFLPRHFYISVLVVLLLGMFTVTKSTSAERLHREQTDEWKGWMQLVVCVYHYTGGRQELHIYMYIRVLVSAYVFMTGYGHMMYALKHRDASAGHVFWRSCQVLFRLNFLSVCLCLVMNNSYQFYYFVPLVSVWFVCITCVVWGAIWVTSYMNKAGLCKDTTVSVCGMVLLFTATSFLIVTTLHQYQELVSSYCALPAVSFMFSLEGSTSPWLFHWSTDRYSALYGIAFGAVLTIWKQWYRDVSLSKQCQAAGLSLIAVLSIPGVLVYLSAGVVCKSKQECNSLHPLFCIIPILSYINLRNICDFTRSRHSQFFTWVGKISLELFVCQYHIWLAADTKGLLVLLPGHPTLNILLTTLIFVCVAHHINTITAKLTKLIFNK